MRKPNPQPSWPESWKISYHYDRMEVFGEFPRSGYARAYRARHDRTLSLVARVAKQGARVLDVAGAQGNFSIALANAGYRVTWNDLREELIDYVRLKHDGASIEFVPGNVFEQNFPQKFDVILACEIIEHVAHPDEFLAKLAALLAPGGHLILSTPNGGYFRNRLPKFSECPDPSQFEDVQFKPDGDGHIFLFHEHELRELAERAGIRVVTVERFTNPLTAGALRTEPLLKYLPRWPVARLDALTAKLPALLQDRLHMGLVALLTT